MNYQVFVQNLAERNFIAAAIGLPNVTANGVTEKDAIDKLKVILDAQFKNGKLVTISVDLPDESTPAESDPWIVNMGIFENDPTFDDFLAEVNTYRREIDATENYS